MTTNPSKCYPPVVAVERVELSLTKPLHGWVKVALHLGDFELVCAASTVMNDPLEELGDFALFVFDGHSGFRRACLWTEPAGYAVDVRPMQEHLVMITVWHDDMFVPPMVGYEMKCLYRCIVPRRCVLESFVGALTRLLEVPSQSLGEPSQSDRAVMQNLRSREAQLRNAVAVG